MKEPMTYKQALRYLKRLLNHRDPDTRRIAALAILEAVGQ